MALDRRRRREGWWRRAPVRGPTAAAGVVSVVIGAAHIGNPPSPVQLLALRIWVTWLLADVVASGSGALLVKIETSMSGSTLALSTFAQLGELGTNRLFFAAAAKVPSSGWSLLVSSSVVELGMTWPTVAIWVWYLVPVISLTHSLATSWFLLFAATPRSEPPRKTGAVWPAVWLGIGKTPSLS